jgi:hypothetical protein
MLDYAIAFKRSEETMSPLTMPKITHTDDIIPFMGKQRFAAAPHIFLTFLFYTVCDEMVQRSCDATV